MSAVVVQVQNKEDKWVVGEKLFLLLCRENNILPTNLVWCLTYCPIFVRSLWRTLYKIRFQLPFIFWEWAAITAERTPVCFFLKNATFLFTASSDNECVISGVICICICLLFENTTFPCCFFLPQTMSGWYQVSFVKEPQHASL